MKCEMYMFDLMYALDSYEDKALLDITDSDIEDYSHWESTVNWFCQDPPSQVVLYKVFDKEDSKDRGRYFIPRSDGMKEYIVGIYQKPSGFKYEEKAGMYKYHDPMNGINRFESHTGFAFRID